MKRGGVPILLLATACSPSQTPAPPTAAGVTAALSPPSRSAQLPEQARPPVACELVPMRLVIEVAGHGPIVMTTLDESGAVGGPPALMDLAKRKAIARFDERGCLFDDEGVVAEITADQLWMPREALPAEGRRVGKFTIEAGGSVRSRGGVSDATMRLLGFEERGLCAAKLLLGAMHAMLAGVSMAVVDGSAAFLPPPSESVCPDRHRPLAGRTP